MATVYQAYQESLDRVVAVKVLADTGDPQFVTRFQREAQLIAKLQHRNIVPIHDYGDQDGVAYLVLQYVEDGRTLADLVGTPLAFARAVGLLTGVLAGLGHAHDQGWIHRDVKPSNVLLPDPDWPLLTDFGIAKLMQEDAAALTATGRQLGTVAYMAPEQALGLKVDARADLYAVGVVLFELLTGRVPFQADPLGCALAARLQGPAVSSRAQPRTAARDRSGSRSLPDQGPERPLPTCRRDGRSAARGGRIGRRPRERNRGGPRGRQPWGEAGIPSPAGGDRGSPRRNCTPRRLGCLLGGAGQELAETRGGCSARAGDRAAGPARQGGIEPGTSTGATGGERGGATLRAAGDRRAHT